MRDENSIALIIYSDMSCALIPVGPFATPSNLALVSEFSLPQKLKLCLLSSWVASTGTLS